MSQPLRLVQLEAVPRPEVSVSPLDSALREINLGEAFTVSLEERKRLADEIRALLSQRQYLSAAELAELASFGVTEAQLRELLDALVSTRAGALVGLKPTGGGLWAEVPNAPVDITRTTAGEVNKIAEEARAEAWTREEWQKAVGESSAFSPARAEQIADWEFDQADMIARLQAWKAAGVREVTVSDDGIPTSCEDCMGYDGEIWSINRAIVTPKEHPNCVRTFYPIWPATALGAAR